jgi:hypothetical protein
MRISNKKVLSAATVFSNNDRDAYKKAGGEMKKFKNSLAKAQNGGSKKDSVPYQGYGVDLITPFKKGMDSAYNTVKNAAENPVRILKNTGAYIKKTAEDNGLYGSAFKKVQKDMNDKVNKKIITGIKKQVKAKKS